MRKFKYVGGEDISMYGVDFPKGKEVEVKDEFLAKKLAGNKYFKEVGKKAEDDKK